MALRSCRYDGREYTVAYDLLNPGCKETILFLHGWGSNKELMRGAFGALLPRLRHLYVDMPGFGKSPNDRFLRTEDYAGILKAFLDELGIAPEIVAGHSFGGKVATLLNPPCLVLLSSAGIQVPKPLSVRAKIALFKLFKPLGISRLRRIFVSADGRDMNPGMYETFKYTLNEAFEERFRQIRGRALLFWGREDTATPLWTGRRIRDLIGEGARIEELEGDHYFFLDPLRARSVAQSIEESCLQESHRGEKR